jgi:flavin reductase (DIM6/NTAB) family NADH-FMN oxidoreductase RutF
MNRRNIIKNALYAGAGLMAVSTLKSNAGIPVTQQGSNANRSREEIKASAFTDLFRPIAPKEIPESVFTLVGEDFNVLTAGNPSHFNSMITSWGGWGILFNNPATFLMLRSNRYTLELMRKEQRYTMAFFDSQYKDDIMPFGASSGRDSDAKMKNTKLSAAETPAGNMVFKEAKLVLECKLIQVTTVSPDDFPIEANRQFITGAFTETKDYHKTVFGEITNVWVRQ